jgi:phosphatidylserine/phosphatidylglycerophosphate/cardiolipin synthase-like enzyme
MKLKRSISSIVSLFVILIASVVQAQQTSDIKMHVTFNTPGFDGKSTTTIEDSIIQTINLASPGSSIRVSLLILDRRPVVEALLSAEKRGVDVRLVLDGRMKRFASGSPMDLLVNGDETHEGLHLCKEKPCIHFCHGPLNFLPVGDHQLFNSCTGVAVNHNKFFLFSQLDNGSQNVVLQTSANIDSGQLKLYNDLLTIENNSQLYKGYMDNWERLKRNHIRLSTPKGFTGGNGAVVYLSPYFEHDPILLLLNRVSCQIPGSRIRISEANFNRTGVVNRLAELVAQGCDVKIIARKDHQIGSPSKIAYEALRAQMMVLPEALTDDDDLTKLNNSPGPKINNSVHTKIILIDASLDHSAEKVPIVLTGSHNLDLFSLRTNDEVLIEIHDRSLLESYMDFWDRLKQDIEEARIELL